MNASLVFLAMVGLAAVIVKRMVAANALIDRLLAGIAHIDEGEETP